MKNIIFLMVLLCFPLVRSEGASDPASEEALRQTKELLRSKEQREAYINSDKKAQRAHDSVNSLTRGEANMENEMYDLAADVFANIAEKARKPNGEIDAEKLKQLMLQYQTNPEIFYGQMTPEQKRRVQKLGQKIGPSSAPSK